MTPLKAVDVLGWTLPTYQWGVVKREGTAIPDGSNSSAPPWLALASDFDSPPFAQRRDCTSKRILKKVMRCNRRSAIISHSAMHPADLLSALTSLPIKHEQSCKTNTHPSSGESGSRGSRLWGKRPWHLMAGQEHMPSMSVLTTEGPNEDFISLLSNIIDHSRSAQVKRDWINSIFHCWWDQLPLSPRLIWQSKQATGLYFKVMLLFLSLSSCVLLQVSFELLSYIKVLAARLMMMMSLIHST